jgi:hypothetical protein
MENQMADRTNSESLWKSRVAGAVGGLVASFAMNQFQAAVSAVAESAARKERERKGLPEPTAKEKNGGDDTTIKAAEAISEEVFGHELAEYEKNGRANWCIRVSPWLLAHFMGIAPALAGRSRCRNGIWSRRLVGSRRNRRAASWPFRAAD